MANSKHRRSIRLRNYDYTQEGAYFVTICTHERITMFGEILNGAMTPNHWGEIVQSCWENIPNHHTVVELDAFVVMPNHMHGIIVITGDEVDKNENRGDKIDVDSRGGMTYGRGMIYHAPTNHAPPINHTPPTHRAPTTNHGPTHHAPTGKTVQTGNDTTPPVRQFSKPIANSLSTIVGIYKAAVTRQINRLPDAPDHPVWQRNFYEHIIRSEDSLQTIRTYIADNPARWPEDRFFQNQDHS